MFRGDNDNTAATTTRRVERTEYRSDNNNANTGNTSGRAYVTDRNTGSNYNNRSYDNNNRNYDRDGDNDNRAGWWENVKDNVKDWWHGDENDQDYDNRGGYGGGYSSGRNYVDRDYNNNNRSSNYRVGGYNTDYNRENRFNVTGRRVDYDRDYAPTSNYRSGAGYGGSYGGAYGGSYGGPSRSYGGNDYDRSYGRTQQYVSSRDHDRSYGGGYGGYGPSYGGSSSYNRDYTPNRSVAVYGGAGSNDYDRLYGNNNQVSSRSRYNNNNDMSDLFGGLSLLQDRHETTPTIVEEGGQRMMQWQFDVQGFNLDDINISDSGNNKIEITGKHEDTGAHHRHARQFTRIVTLPQNTTSKDVKSKINGRGLLTVSVPYTGKSLNDYNSRELTVGTGGSSSKTSGQSSYGNTQHGQTGATTTTTSTSKQQYQSSSNA